MQAVRFRPRLWPTLGTLALAALFIHLGQWQADKGERLADHLAQIAQRSEQGAIPLTSSLVDAEATQSLRLRARGEFMVEQQFYVDNQQYQGRPGIHVVTPLKLADSQTVVLVDRGWVGWGASRKQLPPVATPSGVVELEGMAVIPSNKKPWLVEDKPEAWPQLWPRLDLPRFALLHPGLIQPIVIVQTSDQAQDGLVRHWEPPENKVGMHQSYSLQWYGMALALLVFYVVTSLRPRQVSGAADHTQS